MYYQPLRDTIISFFCILNDAEARRGGGSERNADLYLLEDGRMGRWEDRCFSWHGQTVETFFFVGFSEESKTVAFVSKELLGCWWKQRVH